MPTLKVVRKMPTSASVGTEAARALAAVGAMHIEVIEEVGDATATLTYEYDGEWRNLDLELEGRGLARA